MGVFRTGKRSKKGRSLGDYLPNLLGFCYFTMQYYLAERWLINIFTIDWFVSIFKVFWEALKGLPVLVGLHYSFIVFYFIFYVLRLLWSLRAIFFYIYALFQYFRFFWCLINYIAYKWSLNTEKRLVIAIGSPGAGKSSTSLFKATVLSSMMWFELNYKYYKLRPYVKKWTATANIEKLNAWQEVKESYEFWKAHPNNIPCLITNIPLKVKGKMSMALTRAHADQLKRMPAFAVAFYDELGAEFPLGDSYDKPLSISDFFRLLRHFGDFMCIGTEQAAENVFIDIRRVVSIHEYFLSQQWVCKPLIILLVFNLLKKTLVKLQLLPKVFAPFLIRLERIVRAIGFRHYRYVEEGNTERGAIPGERERILHMYLPSRLPFHYDDRTFRNFYKAKKQDIEVDPHTSMLLADTPETRKSFMHEVDLEDTQAEEQALALADRLLNSPHEAYALELEKFCKTRDKLVKAILNNPDIFKPLQ